MAPRRTTKGPKAPKVERSAAYAALLKAFDAAGLAPVPTSHPAMNPTREHPASHYWTCKAFRTGGSWIDHKVCTCGALVVEEVV